MLIQKMEIIKDKALFTQQRPIYLWDYNISGEQFQSLLDGSLTLGRLDRDWAVLRLIEYAPYEELIRLIGYRGLVEGWSRWRSRVRAQEEREGLDFVVQWVTNYHPELLAKSKSVHQKAGKDG